MIVETDEDLKGIQEISDIVAITLKQMREYAKIGMTTKELDDYGAEILKNFGAKSAPFVTYKFPGWTCISVNNEMAHGIPSSKVLKEGDLVNIDVSAELNGFYGDNGGSFVLGEDINENQRLVDASVEALYKAIAAIKGGIKISEVGRIIERTAKDKGYKVIKNLGGHGVGRGLHEEPDCILNYYDRYEHRRFKKNSIVAIETFITTDSTSVNTLKDGWTLVGNKGGFCVQHEHTVLVTSDKPIILTAKNGI
ncbi:MAG: type I methionyl aminopeptidase [Dysgonomonas mossii]|uniref:type I methionyl aminopeptidase n=1 Tax=Dysgonomonas mossii TaxID=163665 RepID=UPI001E124844|nr:type I methionyl aminopeptidase [Dysgonomonas mossii]MBS5798075.1 type I methionyl aminopeptidase [Dysgonomonas mossii]MBS7112599.1 type I methionyl aminopeptidase [Dysgonomonas mossii]